MSIFTDYVYNSNDSSYFDSIAKGLIPKHSRVYKFGSNRAVSSTEVLVAAGGVYGMPTVARQVTVTSSSGLDIPGGTGARSVTIVGLDASYNEITETIALGGTSINEYLRVYRAWVQECGDISAIGGANKGTITIKQVVSLTNMVIITIGDGQTLCACYTVPNGYTAYLWSADSTTGQGKEALVKLKTREYNGTHAFRVQGARDSYQNTVAQRFVIPSKILARTDIVFTAQSSVSTPVSATFLMQLVAD